MTPTKKLICLREAPSSPPRSQTWLHLLPKRSPPKRYRSVGVLGTNTQPAAPSEARGWSPFLSPAPQVEGPPNRKGLQGGLGHTPCKGTEKAVNILALLELASRTEFSVISFGVSVFNHVLAFTKLRTLDKHTSTETVTFSQKEYTIFKTP